MAISYTKTEWTHGKVISATELNNIENGIAALAGNTDATETRTLTKELDVASSWGETGNITDDNARIIHADTNKVSIYKGTDINGTTTIKGDFEVKSGNNTILKAENASNVLKVSIPNQLIVGTANTQNDTTTYVGTTTFNTATTEIHGATTIDNLTAANVTGSAEISGNLTVGTANTENNVTTYTGTAIFNTTQTQIHGITTIDTLSAANVTGNASVDGTVTAKDGLVVGTATQAKKAKVFGTLETTGNTTIRGTLQTHDSTTINGDLTVSGNRLSATRSTALLGHTTIGDNGVPKDLNVYGTTTTNDLVVNNRITTLAIGTTNIDSLTVGTPETTVNDAVTPATGTTILYGSTTITSLKAETTNIDTLTVGAIKENENTGLTEISGETTLHGITKIDSLIVGQYPNIPQDHNFIEIVGYGADDNNTNNIRTLDIYGNQRIAGTYYGNNIVINKFNGIDVPALPVVEDSLEDPKPYEDGEYMLKLTITGGQPSYSWVAIGGAEP